MDGESLMSMPPRAAKKDKLSDATLRVDWRVSSRWQMGPVRSSSASGGLSYRW